MKSRDDYEIYDKNDFFIPEIAYKDVREFADNCYNDNDCGECWYVNDCRLCRDWKDYERVFAELRKDWRKKKLAKLLEK